jgi:DNA-binding winged helix-turn-helix (wHTH) protein/Tol biopolymer transport system component
MALKSSQRFSMATMPSHIKHFYDFGPFRLDPQRRLLWRGNDTVSLTPKAIETLVVLVQRRDQVVSKDELMNMLWPDSFVEESNLSQNIFLLRKALGDSTQERRYILTVPGRGYQFVGTVREIGEPEDVQAVVLGGHSGPRVAVQEPVSLSSWSRRVWVGSALVLLVILLGAGVAWQLARRPEAVPQFKQRRLTANPSDQPVTHAAISPDGKYLGYSDQQGIHLQMVDTGQTRTVPWPSAGRSEQAFWDFESWYPDSTRFTARLAVPGKPISLWSVPLLEGTPLQLIGDAYGGSAISPDGASIAFLRTPVFLENVAGDPYRLGAREIWLMGPHGESPRRIIAADDLSGFERITWSPVGDRIAYKYWHLQSETLQVSLEISRLNGADRTTILSENRLEDFAWVSSGRVIYSQELKGYGSDYSADDLWDLRLDPRRGTPQGPPHRLGDFSGFSVTGLNATADGKHLAFLRSTRHHSVFVGELPDNAGRIVKARRLTMDDHSNVPFAWTPDSRRVVFLSRRTQASQVYSQTLDGDTPPQLVTAAPAIEFEDVRLAPDGAWLVAKGHAPGSDTVSFYRVPISGGAPQLVFVAKNESCGDFRCANQHANVCVYEVQTPDHRELILKSFDPMLGKRTELLRIPIDPGADYHWALSPDGLQVGVLKSEWGSDQIRFFQVRSKQNRSMTIKGYAELRSLDWAPDSRSVFVGSAGPGGSTLLHIDLSGRVQAIWHQSQPVNTWGVASPDGRRLAIFGTSADANANVWLLDDF